MNIIHTLFVVCSVAILCTQDADAGHVSDYTIDYNGFGATVYREVLLPPLRYRHPPDTDVEVVEVSPAELAVACNGSDVLGCIIQKKSYVAERHHEGAICIKAGRPYICSRVWYEAGAQIASTSCIYLPRVGDIIHGIEITTTYQEAILVHEIGHANGWPSDHKNQ